MCNTLQAVFNTTDYVVGSVWQIGTTVVCCVVG